MREDQGSVLRVKAEAAQLSAVFDVCVAAEDSFEECMACKNLEMSGNLLFG